MNEEETALATKIYGAVQHASNYSERSQQAADFKMGISDIGWCQEKTRRMLAGIPETPGDKLAAFIGTAIGDHTESALRALYPGLIIQSEVSVTLEGEQGKTYEVGGHPDVIDPDEGIVIDVKTVNGLEYVKRNGPSESQQFQRHAYAKGAHAQGMFPNHTLDQIRVANVWLDRSAIDKQAWVQMEPYDEDYPRQMGGWIDDVIYAYLNGEEARKGPPREVCAVTCGHFATCRALDTDVEGLITSSEALTALAIYQEGLALEKEGKRLKNQGKIGLKGINGSTGEFTVRWVEVAGGPVSYNNPGYLKLDLRRIK